MAMPQTAVSRSQSLPWLLRRSRWPVAAGTGTELPLGKLMATPPIAPSEEYNHLGPPDEITIHVLAQPPNSAPTKLRVPPPTGRLTIPLVQDIPAVGKTATELQDYIAGELAKYIEQPIVSVIVNTPEGNFTQQVRIIGATPQPASLPFRANMTVLDAMIAVGGLNEFAAGNRAKLIRQDRETAKQEEYRLRLSDLIRRGDASANVMLMPGDTIIIPESRF